MRLEQGWIDEALAGSYGAKSMSRQGYAAKYIVLHGTGGGTLESNDAWFATPGVEACAHFIIGRDGRFIQGISTALASWSNGVLTTGHAPFLPGGINPNLYTISIELVKDVDNAWSPTEAQALTSFRLIECLCNALNIPRRAGDAHGGIIMHRQIDPVNRPNCPGPYPWEQLWSFLQGEEDMPLQIDSPFARAYFVDQGNGRWKCKTNGFEVFGEIGKYYRYIHGAPRLPTTGEQYNLQKSQGIVWQGFECGIIVYDPRKVSGRPVGWSGDCFMCHRSDPIFKAFFYGEVKKQIAALQEQL